MSQRPGPPGIRFDAALYTIGEWTILRLPERASGKLPSRGQVAVRGTINGHGFETVLEPDGRFGHWMRIDQRLLSAQVIRRLSNSSCSITGRNRTCHRILRQLWQLHLRRSKTYGERSLRWRAGNGFAGSMQLETPTRVNGGSKSASRRCRAGNDGPVASTLPHALTRACQEAAG